MLLPFQIKAMTLLRQLCSHTAQVCCPLHSTRTACVVPSDSAHTRACHHVRRLHSQDACLQSASSLQHLHTATPRPHSANIIQLQLSRNSTAGIS
jgi:hypothetical protein